MHKCNDCGKEFSNAQGLGSHKRFGCGVGAPIEAVRLAEAVVHGLAPSASPPGLRSQVSGLRPQTSKQIRVPDLRPQTSDLARPQTSDLGQVSDLEDLAVYERRVKHLEVMDKLHRRERGVRGRRARQFGIALVLLGVGVYFLGGGNFKLPFFGSVNE